jgi:hypothetical protein
MFIVRACHAAILPSAFVQVASMRIYKRKTKRGATSKETYTETAKKFLVGAFKRKKNRHK